MFFNIYMSIALIAIIVFVLSYIIIISEKVHQTVTAVTGACLMILLGVISQKLAIEGIDFNTIGLLIGMMVIVGIAKQCGMFQYVALWASKVGKGDPKAIFILLAIITAVFSALLDNVTTVLLMVPVTFVIANNLKINPKPYLIGAILLSNIGGAATLIGDPPNILIGSAAGLSFNEFAVNLGPVALLISAVTIAIFCWLYRKEFVASDEAKARIMKFNPKDAITDWKLLKKSLFVLGLVILGFLTHSVTHIEGATLALSGAALLLMLTLHDPEHYIRDVEWTTIFFFVGLFIMVTALQEVGVIRYMANQLIQVTGDKPVVLGMTLLWGSAFFSAIINNIPFVATMIPLIQEIGTLTGVSLKPLWWAMAIGTDIGGNATIIGASANVVVSGMSEKAGHKIGFFEYLKVAVPMTIIALLIATVYVYFRYFM